MIKSLTGFGSVEVVDKSNQLTLLIRSINSRFLDIKFRGIDLDPQFELEIRQEIQKLLIRGNINVQISFKNGGGVRDNIKFDKERYELIENIVGKIQQDYGKNLQLGDLITINDLIINKEIEDIDNSVIMNGLKKALIQLDNMRTKEGDIISKDMINRINIIKQSLNVIKDKSNSYVNELNKKYKEKIKSLLGDITFGEDRIAQEVAILVDKYDFTEEIVRGLSHCEQFSEFLKSNEPIGKKMNFLLQELSREANTIGSKSPTSDISNIVVEIKSEIEKIREQVQNIL